MKSFSQYPLAITRLSVGVMNTNCYIIYDPQSLRGIIIDPGDDEQYISDYICHANISIIGIYATHGHFDHILAGFALEHMFNAPFYIHSNDEFLVKNMKSSVTHFIRMQNCDPPPIIHEFIDTTAYISLGNHHIALMHTPGHTPGSVTYVFEKNKILIVGDVLFGDGLVGRTDFSYCSKIDLEESIKKICSFEKDYMILSGHGEASTIGKLFE